jgi:hypothetical protein
MQVDKGVEAANRCNFLALLLIVTLPVLYESFVYTTDYQARTPRSIQMTIFKVYEENDLTWTHPVNLDK